jgi:uncharacterized protein (TIGR02145 family)
MKKLLVWLVFLCGIVFAQQKGTFTDPRDGKKYKTVKIGEQTWMAENVEYAGPKREIGACRDKKPENCKKYGSLYNWEEAMKVCPSGWHLPSKEEWDVLENFAKVKEDNGKKLKAKKNWGNSNGTDDYGFTALPGGCYEEDYDFGERIDIGCWWSTMIDTREYAYTWSISHYDSGHFFRGSGKSEEHSVRCIRD